jgi:natural product precursor
MKTKNFDKKLALNKRTIANLNSREMRNLHGGVYTNRRECETNEPSCRPTVCETFNLRECNSDETWCACTQTQCGTYCNTQCICSEITC